jgi:hypothetical protein
VDLLWIYAGNGLTKSAKKLAAPAATFIFQ